MVRRCKIFIKPCNTKFDLGRLFGNTQTEFLGSNIFSLWFIMKITFVRSNI